MARFHRQNEVIDWFADCEAVQIPPGTRLIKSGESVTACYLILTGVIQSFLSIGEHLEKVGLFIPGNSLGIMYQLKGHKSVADYIARENCILARFTLQDETTQNHSPLDFALNRYLAGEVATKFRGSIRNLARIIELAAGR